MKRFRKTILDERLVLGQHMGEHYFREELGDFVINYITEHGKVPPHKRLVEEFITEGELKELNLMHGAYVMFRNEEITSKEYSAEIERLL